MEYASKGVGTAGLVTGIVGSLGALNSGLLNGGLGGLFGGGNAAGVTDMAAGAALAAALGAGKSGNSEDRPVSRYELGLVQENAILKAQADVDKKLVDVYNSINNQINVVKERFNDFEKQQLVYNGVNNAAVSVLQSQVAALMGLTKTVIPNGNVCPGWGDVKVQIVTPTTGTTT